MLHQPSGRNGPSPQRRKYTKKYDQIEPSSSQASPTLWGNHCGSDNRDCHTHTHNLAAHCAQAGRNTIGAWLCTKPRHRDCVGIPDAGVHQHRDARHKQHTHSQGNRAVCPSATHMSIRKRDRTKPNRNAATLRKLIGASPPCGEDTPDRRQVQRKEKEGWGASAKSSVLRLTCVPLPHLVLPLSGCACSGSPTKATRGEAGGHP